MKRPEGAELPAGEVVAWECGGRRGDFSFADESQMGGTSCRSMSTSYYYRSPHAHPLLRS